MSAQAAPGDSAALQALFDSTVANNRAAKPRCAVMPSAQAANSPVHGDESAADILTKIGRLTRTIHESLRELGYDKKLEQAAASIPDARERLAYVATLTERAAIRVMNATDSARPIQDQLSANAAALAENWRKVYRAQVTVEEFKSLAAATMEFLDDVPMKTRATNAQLMEIVMAQDFQDLTGQVIKRINALAHRLEQELLMLLLENTPADQRPLGSDDLMNGPVVNAKRCGEVVTTQAQVDELLESLGF